MRYPTRRAMPGGGASLAAATLTMAAMRSALAQDATAPSDAASSAPGNALQVGRFTVTGLSDGVLVPMPPVQPDILADELRALFEMGGADPATFEVPVNAFLVRSDDRTVLIDAGGELPGFPTLGRLGANLRVMGIAPEEIDILLLTHLHVDHIGGMIDADGAPVFTNAEIVLTEAEHAFWRDDEVMSAVPAEQRGMFGSRGTRSAPTARAPRASRGRRRSCPGSRPFPCPATRRDMRAS